MWHVQSRLSQVRPVKPLRDASQATSPIDTPTDDDDVISPLLQSSDVPVHYGTLVSSPWRLATCTHYAYRCSENELAIQGWRP